MRTRLNRKNGVKMILLSFSGRVGRVFFTKGTEGRYGTNERAKNT